MSKCIILPMSVVVALGVCAISNEAHAQFLNYTLQLDTLACEVQTEHGIDEDDEVYMVVSAINSRGVRQVYRVPNSDIEIQEGQTKTLNMSLIGGQLAANEWALVHVAMMESDQGGVETAIIGGIDNSLMRMGPLGCTIFDVGCAVSRVGMAATSLAITVFSLRGQDDFLGSYTVIVQNQNNQRVIANWTQGPGLSALAGYTPQGWYPSMGWRFNNEPPARYWATMRVY
jgi:hypothetical protein